MQSENLRSKYSKSEMWMCRMLIKIITEVADDLYNLHTINFYFSMGTITEGLQLIDILDEDESKSGNIT